MREKAETHQNKEEHKIKYKRQFKQVINRQLLFIQSK